MKFCFFVNMKIQEEVPLLRFLEEQGYRVLRTSIPDEIDQAGKQAQGLMLVFDDAKFAYQFLSSNKWPDFKTLNILYLPKHPKINPEAARMLRSVSLEVIVMGEESSLVEKLENLDSNSEELEIEFNVFEELEKKI